MRERLVGAILIAMIVFATPILAQQEVGGTEVQFQGQLSLSDPKYSGASVVYGRFLSERQEIGGFVNGFVMDNGDFAGTIGPFYRFNLVTGSMVPFLGAGAMKSFGDFGDPSDLVLTLEGGIRYFVTKDLAFTVQALTYHSDFQNAGDQVAIQVGFSRLRGR